MKRTSMKLAVALSLAAFALPAQAQVSGPILVDPETGQETYGGNTTDPDFSPYTPEQQNWDRNNLDTTGTGAGHVGVLARYVIRLPAFFSRRPNQRHTIDLRWTPPTQRAGEVQTVEYEILPGRHSGSQPVQIVETCPSDGYEAHRMYRLVSAGNALTMNGGTLDLSQRITLHKCSRHQISQGDKSLAIRLTGKVEPEQAGEGDDYVASFGPHNSPFNCGPPTWPSAAHQAAGHPPYATWCDLSVSWFVQSGS